jgi:hypothetical protein
MGRTPELRLWHTVASAVLFIVVVKVSSYRCVWPLHSPWITYLFPYTPHTDRLSKPTGRPRLKANVLGFISVFSWRQAVAECHGKRRGSSREVRVGADRRCPRTAGSVPKHRHPADLRAPLPASVHDKTRLKNRLRRQWQITRDPSVKAQIKRLQRPMTYRLNEGRKERCTAKAQYFTVNTSHYGR